MVTCRFINISVKFFQKSSGNKSEEVGAATQRWSKGLACTETWDQHTTPQKSRIKLEDIKNLEFKLRIER